MAYLSPIEKRMRRRRRLTVAAWAVAGFVLLTVLDWPLAHLLMRRSTMGEDWYGMFRSVGYLPTWLIVAAAFVLADRSWGRGSLIAGSATLAGAAAELLKMIVGRERPMDNGELKSGIWYDFRSPLGGFADSHNLGFPSSHTAVAFGGACMVWLLIPRVRVVMLLAAAGCGMTRLLAGAHFSTDVYGGALTGMIVAWWLARAAGVKPTGELIWPPRWTG